MQVISMRKYVLARIFLENGVNRLLLRDTSINFNGFVAELFSRTPSKTEIDKGDQIENFTD